MTVFLITDTHFNHEMLVKMGHRPENFTQTIIDNWQRNVNYPDVVLHLGDVIMGEKKMDRLYEIMRLLPGRKILIRGNHDSYRPSQLYDAGFDFVCDGFRIGEIYFSHEPTRRLPEFVRLNIHGHFHKDGHRFEAAYKQFPWYTDYPERYLLAECETDMGPIPLREFLDRNGCEALDINGRRPYDYLIPSLNNTVV